MTPEQMKEIKNTIWAAAFCVLVAQAISIVATITVVTYTAGYVLSHIR